MAKRSSDLDYDIAEPNAASLAESLRAFSYDLPTAIADLVDNSITAQAGRIWIDFHWDGADSVIVITDDGNGMAEEKLVAAMRPGSQNPLDRREPHDLGRFGLGLKTASFSQCRRVTVRSRNSGRKWATRCWDHDHIAQVNAWQLLRSGNVASEPYFGRLGKLKRGTAVVWQNLDRLVAGQRTDNERAQQIFLQRADAVRRHLAMVFHQLMSGKDGVAILLNDREVEPWDPFLVREPATQTLPESKLSLRGETVHVQPFILPHHSKLSKSKHEAAAGSNGWNAHQGFYVYRNRRLLVAGEWLGFGWAKEEHYKLARIRIEIPNELDHDWGIDVTKSRARPPVSLRDELRRIGERSRSEAKRVYSHRGAKLTPKADEERVLLWEPLAKHDKTFYRLNRQHPLLKQALDKSSDRQVLGALLRLIEETVPYPHISINNSEKPNSLPGPFEHAPETQVREVMKEAFESLVATGYGRKEAADRLRTIWPFELFPAVLQSLAEAQSSS
ncbi:MAG: ATP-binding protein [Luteolibacter sp.]